MSTNFFAISSFLIALVCLLEVVLVWRKSQQKIKKIFILFFLISAWWSFFYGLWMLATSHDSALLFVWLFSIGSTLIPILHLHWILALLNAEKRYKPVLWYGYASSIVFLIFNFTPLFIQDVEPTFGFSFWPKPGILYHWYVVVNFAGLHLIALWLLVRYYKQSSGIQRSQIVLVLIAFLISVPSGATNFPLWYDINIKPYGNPLVLAYPLFYGYIILRYRLLDIRFAVRRGTIRIFLAAFTYGMFHLVTWAMIRAFGSVWARPALIVGIFIAIAFVLVLPLVEKGVIKLTNRYLYASIYNAQKTLRSLTHTLTTIVDAEKISALITETAQSVLDVEYTAIFVQEPAGQGYHLVRSAGVEKKKDAPRAIRDGFFTEWIRDFKKAVVKDELPFMALEQSKKGAEKFTRAQKYMEKIQGEVCIPFVVKRDLVGFLLLGAKRSRDAFTKEDIELLETLGNQAAVAIENALLYEHMEEIVAEQTKEIKEKNVHLEKLLAMRSQFLDIASHQLRTPISVIKGYVSMLREGDYDTAPPAEKEDVLRAIAEKTEKLSNIVRDILYASELDTGEFVVKEQDLAVFPIAPYLEKVIHAHKDEASAKNISLTFDAREEDIRVRASERYLEVVFDNMITNALHYTPEDGTIRVRINPLQEVVRIEVADTGIGIPQEDQPGLFEKFKRGSNANSVYTDGSGLGLFIIKEFMDAHPKGRVGFTSELGHGATFWVEVEKYG